MKIATNKKEKEKHINGVILWCKALLQLMVTGNVTAFGKSSVFRRANEDVCLAYEKRLLFILTS